MNMCSNVYQLGSDTTEEFQYFCRPFSKIELELVEQ